VEAGIGSSDDVEGSRGK
jgi:hypothetical protein